MAKTLWQRIAEAVFLDRSVLLVLATAVCDVVLAVIRETTGFGEPVLETGLGVIIIVGG